MRFSQVPQYTTASAHIAFISMLGLVPFAMLNLIQNRYALGLGTLAVIVITALNVFERYRGANRSAWLLTILVPSVVALLCLSVVKLGATATYWIFPAIIAYYCVLDVNRARLVNAITLLFVIPTVWIQLETGIALMVTATVLAVSIFSMINASATNQYQAILETKVVTDPLTGLLNRTLLDDTLSAATRQFQRQGTPMTVLLFDLDNFKTINDTDGHEAGDRVLTGVSEIIKQNIRISDSCFRIGGEEIVCLLYGSDYANGYLLAERIRSQIESADFNISQASTTSIGVSSLHAAEDWKSWLGRADKNLYEAKAAGKNCVA